MSGSRVMPVQLTTNYVCYLSVSGLFSASLVRHGAVAFEFPDADEADAGSPLQLDVSFFPSLFLFSSSLSSLGSMMGRARSGGTLWDGRGS